MNRRKVLTLFGGGSVTYLSGCLSNNTIAEEGGLGDGGSPNPWGKDTLVVAVEQRVAAQGDFINNVVISLDYWEENAEIYAGYPISFQLRPNSDNPDIKILLVERISTCGEHEDQSEYAGCADWVQDQAPDTAQIWIVAGYDAAYTVETLKHELGHVLGLGHDDEPAQIMSNNIEDRIPHYHEKLEILDKYDDVVDLWNKGSDSWNKGVSDWNSEDYLTADFNYNRAAVRWDNAITETEEALRIAKSIEALAVVDRLSRTKQKIELRRLAAEKMTQASRYASNGEMAMAEASRRNAEADIEEAKEIEMASGAELADLLGLVQRKK